MGERKGLRREGKEQDSDGARHRREADNARSSTKGAKILLPANRKELKKRTRLRKWVVEGKGTGPGYGKEGDRQTQGAEDKKIQHPILKPYGGGVQRSQGINSRQPGPQSGAR